MFSRDILSSRKDYKQDQEFVEHMGDFQPHDLDSVSKLVRNDKF
jgi:hypothetical protein